MLCSIIIGPATSDSWRTRTWRGLLLQGLCPTPKFLSKAQKPLRKPPAIVQAHNCMDFLAGPRRGVVLEQKIVRTATRRKRGIDLTLAGFATLIVRIR